MVLIICREEQHCMNPSQTPGELPQKLWHDVSELIQKLATSLKFT